MQKKSKNWPIFEKTFFWSLLKQPFLKALKFVRGLHKCAVHELILRPVIVSSEKKFFWKLVIFQDFFAYPGSQICLKNVKLLFWEYRPEICRGLHKMVFARNKF